MDLMNVLCGEGVGFGYRGGEERIVDKKCQTISFADIMLQ